MRAFALLALPVLLAGCGQSAHLSADQAWVRLPAVSGRPGAAYFTVHGGSDDATLVAVTTPVAVRAELHQSMEAKDGAAAGMASMKKISAAAVPADGTLAFAPGGKHVMLFDIDPEARPGDTTTLSLSFADGETLEIPARLIAPADPSPY